ncbi:hypothetical protein GH714_010258 [Hevea brasiliensis]|uniref:RRM domain-containing protein n=1 Tax=Hevea brasiliensis TaxID=3981 RepID=A0A6A6LYG1_HEVBR|nr:hypothetical protein GH714_010258 [Hevea brasiliensis]
MYDHNTQRPRGFGFITYDSEETVDKVLHKTFHELNGKMVEVKRAVPKELSPGPTRSQLSGYNFGASRVGSFLNGYTQTQGYNPSSTGGFGVRMDGRFSPVTAGRNNFSPFGPGFGMGLHFDQRFDSPIGYNGVNGGNSSALNSTARTLWSNGMLEDSGIPQLIRDKVAVLALPIAVAILATIVEISVLVLEGDIHDNGPLYRDSAWPSFPLELEGSGSFDFGLGNAATDAVTKNSAGYGGGYSVTNRQANRGIAA